MRIGELAARSGVEPTTIRYYERIELMPEPTRKESGYRDYGEEAAARLGFIRAAQSVGLTLGEIRETLAFRDRGETPCVHVAALIERHAAQLRERIAALEVNATRPRTPGQQSALRLLRRGLGGGVLPHHRKLSGTCHAWPGEKL